MTSFASSYPYAQMANSLEPVSLSPENCNQKIVTLKTVPPLAWHGFVLAFLIGDTSDKVPVRHNCRTAAKQKKKIVPTHQTFLRCFFAPHYGTTTAKHKRTKPHFIIFSTHPSHSCYYGVLLPAYFCPFPRGKRITEWGNLNLLKSTEPEKSHSAPPTTYLRPPAVF